MNIFIILAALISGYLGLMNFKKGTLHLFKTLPARYHTSKIELEVSWYQGGAIFLVGSIALFICGFFDYFDKGIMIIVFSVYSMQTLVLLLVTIVKYRGLFSKVFSQILMLLLILAFISLGAISNHSF